MVTKVKQVKTQEEEATFVGDTRVQPSRNEMGRNSGEAFIDDMPFLFYPPGGNLPRVVNCFDCFIMPNDAAASRAFQSSQLGRLR